MNPFLYDSDEDFKAANFHCNYEEYQNMEDRAEEAEGKIAILEEAIEEINGILSDIKSIKTQISKDEALEMIERVVFEVI